MQWALSLSLLGFLAASVSLSLCMSALQHLVQSALSVVEQLKQQQQLSCRHCHQSQLSPHYLQLALLLLLLLLLTVSLMLLARLLLQYQLL